MNLKSKEEGFFRIMQYGLACMTSKPFLFYYIILGMFSICLYYCFSHALGLGCVPLF